MDGARVEFAIRLPGQDDGRNPVWLPIDAKFPKEQYERLVEAADRADADGVATAGRELDRAVRLEAKTISEKYLSPPLTTDFAILFLPVSLAAVRLSRFAFRVLPGQQVGLAGAIIAALTAGGLVSFPFGRLFVANDKASGGRVAWVYILESLGSAVAGLFLQWALLPVVSNWAAAAVVGGFGLALLPASSAARRWPPATLAVAAVLAALVVLDLPSQRGYWKPFIFAGGRHTRHGKLQVVKTGEQVFIYVNGARAFSSVMAKLIYKLIGYIFSHSHMKH